MKDFQTENRYCAYILNWIKTCCAFTLYKADEKNVIRRQAHRLPKAIVQSVSETFYCTKSIFYLD